MFGLSFGDLALTEKSMEPPDPSFADEFNVPQEYAVLVVNVPRAVCTTLSVLLCVQSNGGSIHLFFRDTINTSMYLVCGAGACPFIVTRTALSWSGDKEGVTQVPCY